MGLIEQYAALHRQGKFLGLSVLKFADEIGELIKQCGCETLLDYGSGQGHQYLPPHSLDKKWGVEVQCYDPAVDGMNTFNSAWSFDAVICSDVLEHIPEDQVQQTLGLVFGFAKRLVFLTVCCRAARKTFPDGSNVHVTIKPYDWWFDAINRVAPPGIQWVLRETP